MTYTEAIDILTKSKQDLNIQLNGVLIYKLNMSDIYRKK